MSQKWKLKRTVQCAKCPWRKDVNPHDIPNGYDAKKHGALKKTIAEPGSLDFLSGGAMHVMACHESHDAHCIGWLMHQLGDGNNIAMRLRIRSCANFDAVKLCGEQHQSFEDTLPEDS